MNKCDCKFHCKCMNMDHQCPNPHYRDGKFCKESPKPSELRQLIDKLDNAIFESKEDFNSIEHVDMNFSEFVDTINKIIYLSHDTGEYVQWCPVRPINE